jgi:hypothetical protein
VVVPFLALALTITVAVPDPIARPVAVPNAPCPAAPLWVTYRITPAMTNTMHRTPFKVRIFDTVFTFSTCRVRGALTPSTTRHRRDLVMREHHIGDPEDDDRVEESCALH